MKPRNLAWLFAAEGTKVVIGDVRDELTRQSATAINAQHGANRARAVYLDVRRIAVETCEREFGGHSAEQRQHSEEELLDVVGRLRIAFRA